LVGEFDAEALGTDGVAVGRGAACGGVQEATPSSTARAAAVNAGLFLAGSAEAFL
jgi:hypothetical protein